MQNICPNCFQESQDVICVHCGWNRSGAGGNNGVLPLFTELHGRYRIGRTLGIGGFGVTYVAQDMFNGSRCAIKEFMPLDIAVRDGIEVVESTADNAGIFEHCRKNFINEARILASVSSNPCIVGIHDYFRENNTAYLVMELLEGSTLSQMIRTTGAQPPALATKMLLEIGSALMTVHEKGILHRDISPENIYCTDSGAFKLLDFGASRYFVSEKSRSLSVYLKPGFAPPEQYSSHGNQGPWTDVYGLAATYYNALTGTALPDTMDRLSGGKFYEPISTFVPGFSLQNIQAIDRALALNWKDRFAAVSDFFNALDLNSILPVSQEQEDGGIRDRDDHTRSKRLQKDSLFTRFKRWLRGEA